MKKRILRKIFFFGLSILNYTNKLVPFYSKCDYLLLKFGIVKIQLFLIKGKIKNTNHSTIILFIGKKTNSCQFSNIFKGTEIEPQQRANHFAATVLSKIEKIEYIGEFLKRQVNLDHFENAEIIVVGPNVETNEKLRDQGFLILPKVSFSLNLNYSWQELKQNLSRRRRRSLKKIRNIKYTYIVSRNNENNFDFFYWKMYLPYIRNRFGFGSQPTSYLNAKEFYRKNGGIIFVLEKNRPRAGILFFLKNNTTYAVGLGAYQGNQQYLKNFACEAALFFLIEWSKKNNLERLNYGGTVPFFANGVFIYKREMGMVAEQDFNQLFCALKSSSLNDKPFSFLLQNPTIFLEEDKIKGLVFINHKLSKVELQKLYSTYIFPKMDSLIVISYYNIQTQKTNDRLVQLNSQSIPFVLRKPLSNIRISCLKRGFNVDVFSGKEVSEVRLFKYNQ